MWLCARCGTGKRRKAVAGCGDAFSYGTIFTVPRPYPWLDADDGWEGMKVVAKKGRGGMVRRGRGEVGAPRPAGAWSDLARRRPRSRSLRLLVRQNGKTEVSR